VCWRYVNATLRHTHHAKKLAILPKSMWGFRDKDSDAALYPLFYLSRLRRLAR